MSFTHEQWQIQKFGIRTGAEAHGWDLERGLYLVPIIFFGKFHPKTMHFSAKFSLVLRCIQSMKGKGAPPSPIESANAHKV